MLAPFTTIRTEMPRSSVARVTSSETRKQRTRLLQWRHRPDEKIELLLRCEALAGLDRGDATLLARAVEVIDVAAGELIAVGADAQRWWWMPLDGGLEGTSSDGSTFVLEPGRACGTSREWRSMSVTLAAVDSSRVLVSDRRHVLGAADSSPALAKVLERAGAWSRDQRPDEAGAGATEWRTSA